MKDIKSHPWYTSTDLPTDKLIKEEFKIREQKAKDYLNAERAERRK